jgi:nitrous-oxide reductase
MKRFRFKTLAVLIMTASCLLLIESCKPKTAQSAAGGDAAKSYVAPGSYDEFYNIVSGGFNGQVGIYGIPSGRLFRIVPVFSVNPESGYGYSEETKPMLNSTILRFRRPMANTTAGGHSQMAITLPVLPGSI